MKIEFVQEIIDIIRGKKTLTEKPTIPFLVFWVGTKCTLRCQDCCNWIPYIEQKSYDAKEIIKDIIYLSKKTNIKRVQLQGGEIFTHPKADLIIDRIAKKVKAEEISITTNATLKLKHNIIDVLKKHPKIGLTVSNYDCAKDQRTNFIKQLNDNNISYHLYDFCNNDNTWFKTGSPLTPERKKTCRIFYAYYKFANQNALIVT